MIQLSEEQRYKLYLHDKYAVKVGYHARIKKKRRDYVLDYMVYIKNIKDGYIDGVVYEIRKGEGESIKIIDEQMNLEIGLNVNIRVEDVYKLEYTSEEYINALRNRYIMIKIDDQNRLNNQDRLS